MSVHPTCTCALALAAALPLASSSLTAQESILLRYQPRERLVVHITSATDGEAQLALGGLMAMIATIGEGFAEAFGDTSGAIGDSLRAAMDEASADSITVEISMQQYLTDQVLEASDVRRSVYRTVDSTVMRTRAEGEEWEEADPGQYPRTSAEAVIDDRLRIVEFNLIDSRPEHQKFEGNLRAPYGGLELHFPEEALTPGDGWSANVQFPMTLAEGVEAGGEEGSPSVGMDAPPDLVARTRITLDSLVHRGADTLAYLRVRGVFDPSTVESDSADVASTITTEGSIAGTLVWSTGWSAFVSGSWRARLTMDMSLEMMGMTEPIDVGLRIDLVHRFQVRP